MDLGERILYPIWIIAFTVLTFNSNLLGRKKDTYTEHKNILKLIEPKMINKWKKLWLMLRTNMLEHLFMF